MYILQKNSFDTIHCCYSPLADDVSNCCCFSILQFCTSTPQTSALLTAWLIYVHLSLTLSAVFHEQVLNNSALSLSFITICVHILSFTHNKCNFCFLDESSLKKLSIQQMIEGIRHPFSILFILKWEIDIYFQW